MPAVDASFSSGVTTDTFDLKSNKQVGSGVSTLLSGDKIGACGDSNRLSLLLTNVVDWLR
jgi:hypothetical protein